MHVMGMKDKQDNPKCWLVHSSRKTGSTNNSTTNQVFATKGTGTEEQRLGDLKKKHPHEDRMTLKHEMLMKL